MSRQIQPPRIVGFNLNKKLIVSINFYPVGLVGSNGPPSKPLYPDIILCIELGENLHCPSMGDSMSKVVSKINKNYHMPA